MIIQFINIEYKIFFYSESDLYACYHIMISDNFLRYPDSYIILTDISDILLLLLWLLRFYFYFLFFFFYHTSFRKWNHTKKIWIICSDKWRKLSNSFDYGKYDMILLLLYII